MNWKSKAYLFRLAAALPGGEWLDRRRKHRLAGTERVAVELHLTPALKMLRRLRDELGFDIDGKRALEIGAGWNPVYGVLLSILGARRVTLLDVRPYLVEAGLAHVAGDMAAHAETIAERTGRDAGGLRARLESIRSASGLRAMLDAARIDYLAPADAARTGLPEGSVDLVCSTCVLEHIPADALRAIHAETARILMEDGAAYHIVDLSDHFAHGDPTIHRLNFLRFEDRTWRRLGQHRLFYLNRLRVPQIVEQIEGAGLKVRHLERQSSPEDLAFVRSIELPESLRGVSPEDAAVHLIHVVATKRQTG